MERSHLICTLIGRITNQDESINADDLRYEIDQRLEKCCLPLLGQEKGDLELLDEVLAECMIYVMGQKINRRMRRKH